jgi:hypothetical protein
MSENYISILEGIEKTRKTNSNHFKRNNGRMSGSPFASLSRADLETLKEHEEI